MRSEEIRKWIEEGGDLPQDLTSKEKEHLKGLGWKAHREWYSNGQLGWEQFYLSNMLHGVDRQWYENGQLMWEKNFLHGILHGVYRRFDPFGGQLELDEEWFYGNKIR